MWVNITVIILQVRKPRLGEVGKHAQNQTAGEGLSLLDLEAWSLSSCQLGLRPPGLEGKGHSR